MDLKKLQRKIYNHEYYLKYRELRPRIKIMMCIRCNENEKYLTYRYCQKCFNTILRNNRLRKRPRNYKKDEKMTEPKIFNTDKPMIQKIKKLTKKQREIKNKLETINKLNDEVEFMFDIF